MAAKSLYQGVPSGGGVSEPPATQGVVGEATVLEEGTRLDAVLMLQSLLVKGDRHTERFLEFGVPILS